MLLPILTDFFPSNHSPRGCATALVGEYIANLIHYCHSQGYGLLSFIIVFRWVFRQLCMSLVQPDWLYLGILVDRYVVLTLNLTCYSDGNQPGAPNEGFLINTLKTLFTEAIQSTFRSLEMHSQWCYKICICSVILGQLKSF